MYVTIEHGLDQNVLYYLLKYALTWLREGDHLGRVRAVRHCIRQQSWHPDRMLRSFVRRGLPDDIFTMLAPRGLHHWAGLRGLYLQHGGGLERRRNAVARLLERDDHRPPQLRCPNGTELRWNLARQAEFPTVLSPSRKPRQDLPHPLVVRRRVQPGSRCNCHRSHRLSVSYAVCRRGHFKVQ